ncbi:MAG: hypothetical protein AB7V01_17800 [Vicinamibacterales bacterium]
MPIERVPLRPAALAGLIQLVEDGTISSSVAKDVFQTMYATGRAAAEIVDSEGLRQISDEGAIDDIARRVVDANAAVVEEIRAGKDKKLQFLVGQVMKETKGKASPPLASAAIRRLVFGDS